MEGILEPAELRVIYVNVQLLFLFFVLLPFAFLPRFVILQEVHTSTCEYLSRCGICVVSITWD